MLISVISSPLPFPFWRLLRLLHTVYIFDEILSLQLLDEFKFKIASSPTKSTHPWLLWNNSRLSIFREVSCSVVHDGPVVIWCPKRVHKTWLSKIAFLAWQETLQRKTNIHYSSMRWLLKISRVHCLKQSILEHFLSLLKGRRSHSTSDWSPCR